MYNLEELLCQKIVRFLNSPQHFCYMIYNDEDISETCMSNVIDAFDPAQVVMEIEHYGNNTHALIATLKEN